MAGAIAHEVNQPLTALINYARSARMVSAGKSLPELDAIVEKMLHEADRAADIVRRLRDFFRAGSTRLEQVNVADVLATALRMGESAAGPRQIAITNGLLDDLPPLFVDRLQI